MPRPLHRYHQALADYRRPKLLAVRILEFGQITSWRGSPHDGVQDGAGSTAV